MEVDLVKIAGTFGIPVALLFVLVVALWRAGRFLANEVVEPLTQAAVAHLLVQQKATLEMAAVLVSVSENLKAIHADQLKLLAKYRIVAGEEHV